jgi:hypothetical protein
VSVSPGPATVQSRSRRPLKEMKPRLREADSQYSLLGSLVTLIEENPLDTPITQAVTMRAGPTCVSWFRSRYAVRASEAARA